MNRRTAVLTAIACGACASSAPAAAQEREQPRPAIRTSGGGWMLTVNRDCSGHLQFGAGAFDGWKFKAGTIDVAQAEKDLRALPADATGKGGYRFTFQFESERTSPARPAPAHYTKDQR